MDSGIEWVRPALDALEGEWRALEGWAEASFFQSWTWVGCCAAERYPRPWLLRVREDGRVVALGLFNETRRRGLGTVWLGESGDPALDAVFTEYNGILAEPGAAGLEIWLATAMGRQRRVVLSGVDPACAAAAARVGVVRELAVRPAYRASLEGVNADAFLAGLSRSARQQLRRSDRLYGVIAVQRAETVYDAQAMLAALVALHCQGWATRGRATNLARPTIQAFLRALVDRGVPTGEVDLLRIEGSAGPIGYLLTVRRGGWVGYYQGGFDYAGAGPQQKPGMSCHHAAIRFYIGQGAAAYDFMAGEGQLKRTLSNASVPLHWLEVAPRWSGHGLVMRARARVARHRG